ncbi:hypothetical protein [Piscirickettsia litoralis]|uniref:Uncharacterized protein n=1 Tax=Piscirickettsia litoralis TaxID=1891921 RepID=A0ABX2ZWB5_9GAMM|nr:hypothetical protein [Piscirickettsia litoralis]ODN40917.1 hypothetical protein BGC07_19130 [Piscirickettsia litoralis]
MAKKDSSAEKYSSIDLLRDYFLSIQNPAIIDRRSSNTSWRNRLNEIVLTTEDGKNDEKYINMLKDLYLGENYEEVEKTTFEKR